MTLAGFEPGFRNGGLQLAGNVICRAHGGSNRDDGVARFNRGQPANLWLRVRLLSDC